MKISKKCGLNKVQAELDFVDIDLNKDISLYVDPYFLANRTDRWSVNATRTIRAFFQHLLSLLAADKISEAKQIFSNLHGFRGYIGTKTTIFSAS